MAIKRINCGRGHRYTIDGEKALGVTTAIGEGVAKPGLIIGAAKCLAQRVVDMSADEWVALRDLPGQGAYWDLVGTHTRAWSKAAARGTKVHHYAERMMRGEEVDPPDELYGYVLAAKSFMDQWQVTPVLIEASVGDYTHKYAGTFDLIADVPDGRRILFDYKTSETGIWPETALQLTAYRFASHYVAADGTEIPMTEVRIDECKAVHLRSDGYDVYPLRSDAAVFSMFLHVLNVARHKQGWESWVGEPERPA